MLEFSFPINQRRRKMEIWNKVEKLYIEMHTIGVKLVINFCARVWIFQLNSIQWNIVLLFTLLFGRTMKIEGTSNRTCISAMQPDSLIHWIGYFTPEAHAVTRKYILFKGFDRSTAMTQRNQPQVICVQCFYILIRLWLVLCHPMYGMDFKHIRPHKYEKNTTL